MNAEFESAYRRLCALYAAEQGARGAKRAKAEGDLPAHFVLGE
jgi:hypothetical protein